jgi:nucleotide-binding universal stress UspA family protein
MPLTSMRISNEFVLGGVTRTMLTSMTVPVLMSH